MTGLSAPFSTAGDAGAVVAADDRAGLARGADRDVALARELAHRRA